MQQRFQNFPLQSAGAQEMVYGQAAVLTHVSYKQEQELPFPSKTS